MSDGSVMTVAEVWMTAIVALETKALGLKLKDFAVRERHLGVDFLLHLLEFDNRRGWVEFNCRSLWDFCTSELGLLDCATSFRVRAVQILRDHPQAEGYLRDGRLTLTTLVPLRTILTRENATALFDRCSRMSRRDVERIVAEHDPKPGPQTTIRALPVRNTPPTSTSSAEVRVEEQAPMVTCDARPTTTHEPLPTAPAAEASSAPNNVTSEPETPRLALVAPVERKRTVAIRPVNGREYAFNATVDQAFVDLLDEAKNLYSHTIPTGDAVEILRRALQIAVEEKRKQKAGLTRSPRKPSTDDDTILTAQTKREVWERDEGACAWRYSDGKLCGSRWMVEFDHVVPPKLGGTSLANNVRLLCREHNEQHARNVYGDSVIDLYKRKRAKE